MFLRRDLSGFPPQEHLLYCVEQDVSAPLELPAGAWARLRPPGQAAAGHHRRQAGGALAAAARHLGRWRRGRLTNLKHVGILYKQFTYIYVLYIRYTSSLITFIYCISGMFLSFFLHLLTQRLPHGPFWWFRERTFSGFSGNFRRFAFHTDSQAGF